MLGALPGSLGSTRVIVRTPAPLTIPTKTVVPMLGVSPVPVRIPLIPIVSRSHHNRRGRVHDWKRQRQAQADIHMHAACVSLERQGKGSKTEETREAKRR